MGLFSKTGEDSINLGGHKVPIALIGGIAALLGVVLVLRARSKSAQVASVGQVPAANTGVNPVIQSTAPDYSGALTNLNEQLVGISQQISSLGPSPAPAAALPPPASTPPPGQLINTPVTLNPETATIRASGALAGTQFAGWDLVHPEGVPVGSAPTGAWGGLTLPFGSRWQVLGQQGSMVELQGPAAPVWIAARDIALYQNAPIQ